MKSASYKKACTRCGAILPISEYQVRKASNDGLTASCKKCLADYDKRRYQVQPSVRERHKRYQATNAGKASGKKSKKKWTQTNPIKKGASTIVGNAVRDGRLEKPNNCSECGEVKSRIHGHHDDYAFPLVVRWLCSKCHTAWHEKNGEGLNG